MDMVEQDLKDKSEVALPLFLVGALVAVILAGYIWWIFYMFSSY